jgi:hypothetical protein
MWTLTQYIALLVHLWNKNTLINFIWQFLVSLLINFI